MGILDKIINIMSRNNKDNLSILDTPRYTPNYIDKLGPKEIFVFGSNLDGNHYGGASEMALRKFGAIKGIGAGLQGQSYAIPTMKVGIEEIKAHVERFITFAKGSPHLTFYVTKIGCGSRGLSPQTIAPLFKRALGVRNILLPKEFVEILESQPLVEKDILVHAHGVSRTFADVVITLNKTTPFSNPEEVMTALKSYFKRFTEAGDEVAFTAIRTLWSVLTEEDIFCNGQLEIERFRKRIFDYDSFCQDYDKAYLLHCKEKICNIISYLNEFRRYKSADDILEDLPAEMSLSHHCGPISKSYILSPVFNEGGGGYPMVFFEMFLKKNWHRIAPDGVLEPKLLYEYMFDKHERGVRKYGLETVIRHDYQVSGSPCHPEVFIPKEVGTGPVYVQRDVNGKRSFVRSCGEGIGPNSIPNYLEFVISMSVMETDSNYKKIGGYYVPTSDITLPIYNEWAGKVDFPDIAEKRAFIDRLFRRNNVFPPGRGC